MNSELDHAHDGCRYILEPGIFFNNGSMRCTHYCLKPWVIGGDGKCAKHAGLAQRFPRAVDEKDISRHPGLWNIFYRMRLKGVCIVARRGEDASYFDFCHASDGIDLKAFHKLDWDIIVKNQGAIDWLRGQVAKIL
jgi:hypothetical protein